MDINKTNYLGSIIALIILITCNLIFIFRLLGLSKIEYWIGLVFILTSLPIIFLLFKANEFQRPTIYYIQFGVMLTFILVELFLDYLFKVDFRHTRWMVISYATLFFAATGGMIGIASLSGRIYSIIAVILFLIMTFLAFFQRVKTGM
jgi:hypothetical protein